MPIKTPKKPCTRCDGTGKEPDLKRLKLWRQLAGLTQGQVAKAIGLKSTSFISACERGERRMKPEMAKRYLEFINQKQ
jgi:transcriptional regulator with XRE-family HTH domain